MDKKSRNWDSLEWTSFDPVFSNDEIVDDCMIYSIEEIDGSEIDLKNCPDGSFSIEMKKVPTSDVKTERKTTKSKKKSKQNRKKKHKIVKKGEQNDTKDQNDEDKEDFVAETKMCDSVWGDNIYLTSYLVNKLQDVCSFSVPTPIQEAVIPLGLTGGDIIASSETGSGKTLAYALPILQRLLISPSRDQPSKEDTCSPRALILAPTRELAQQVAKHIHPLIPREVGCVELVGGMSVQKQQRLLRRHPQIIVATPGRLIQLISPSSHDKGGDETSVISLAHLEFLVIDEADRMVEEGHFSELTSILQLAQINNPQIFLLSATMFSTDPTTPQSSSSTNPDFHQLVDQINFSSSPHVVQLSSAKSNVERSTDTTSSSFSLPASLSLSKILSQQQNKVIL